MKFFWSGISNRKWVLAGGLVALLCIPMLFISLLVFHAKKPDVPAICSQKQCPNIVLVILDDMPWDHFGFLSADPALKTPQLDALARQGFVFNNTYNTNSRCRPSLATYLTGKLPHQNLIYANQGVLKLYDEKALPKVLGEAGYATFVGGKMWEGNAEQLKLSAADLDTFHFVRKTQQALADFLAYYAGKQPVFVWWAPRLPHMAHNPPEKYFDMIHPDDIVIPDAISDAENYRRAEHAFLATIAWVDDEVGQLEELLKKNALADNTWIVVLTDNGWSNAYTAKGGPYDIGVRTPMIIIGPGVKVGSTNRLISTDTLYGSILHLAGLKEDTDRLAPEDIFKFATDPVDDEKKDEKKTGREKEVGDKNLGTVFWASYPGYTGKSEPDPRAERDVYALSLREDKWQYTFYVKSFEETGDEEDKAPANIHAGMSQAVSYAAGDEDLFDLSTDPYSQHNLSGMADKQATVLRLRKRVFAWWLSTGGKIMDSLSACEKQSNRACQKFLEIRGLEIKS